MNKCPIHDLPLQTRHAIKPPFRRFYQCPESANNSCNYTDWIDKEPAGSQPQASSLPQGSSSGPLSQDVNVSPTPSGSQTNPSSQPYQEPPSTPTPKRNFSTIDSNEKRQASSHKRLRIIQETLASPSPAEHPTATSSQNSKFKPAIGIASIQYDNPSGLVPQPSTPLRTSEPVASGSNEDPFQDSSVVARGDVVRAQSLCATSVQQTDQDESSDVVVGTVSDMIRRLETLPEYIRKFEGRKIAAEKSRDAKSTKMINLQHRVDDLEREVQRLRAREKQLEEVIEVYEQQS